MQSEWKTVFVFDVSVYLRCHSNLNAHYFNWCGQSMGMRCERELYKCYQLQDAFGALALYLGQKRPYGSFFLLSRKCAYFVGLFKNYHLDKCRSKRNKRQRFAKRKVNENKRHKMFCTTRAAIWQFSSLERRSTLQFTVNSPLRMIRNTHVKTNLPPVIRLL